MKTYKWNDERECKFFNSYTGAVESLKSTPKKILADNSILAQDKIAVMQIILLEIIEKVENEDLLEEFNSLMEAPGL